MDLSTVPIAEIIAANRYSIVADHPFFGYLVLHSRYHLTDEVPTAATDGSRIFINEEFWRTLTSRQQRGVLLHEVLHMALQHVPRCHERDHKLWNIAADVVVNATVRAATSYDLPKGVIEMPKMAHLSVEEIYSLLLDEQQKNPSSSSGGDEEADGSTGKGAGKGAGDEDGKTGRGGDRLAGDLRPDLDGGDGAAADPGESPAEAARRWSDIMEQAKILHHGNLPGSLNRELELGVGSVPWQQVLADVVSQSRDDYDGFDRRYIAQGMYLDALDSEQLVLAICVDTSGSVSPDLLKRLATEVVSLVQTYQGSVKGVVFFADTELSAPYPIEELPAEIPGGGGTDFRPFFEWVETQTDLSLQAVVYLTDGFGDYPECPPACPVIWCITPGGVDSVPFGMRVAMV